MENLNYYSELINNTLECNANAINAIELDGAVLVAFTFGEFGETTSAVIYNDGTIFTQSDWQCGYYAKDANDIEFIEWRLGVTEQSAVIVDGMPRMI